MGEATPDVVEGGLAAVEDVLVVLMVVEDVAGRVVFGAVAMEVLATTEVGLLGPDVVDEVVDGIAEARRSVVEAEELVVFRSVSLFESKGGSTDPIPDAFLASTGALVPGASLVLLVNVFDDGAFLTLPVVGAAGLVGGLWIPEAEEDVVVPVRVDLNDPVVDVVLVVPPGADVVPAGRFGPEEVADFFELSLAVESDDFTVSAADEIAASSDMMASS